MVRKYVPKVKAPPILGHGDGWLFVDRADNPANPANPSPGGPLGMAWALYAARRGPRNPNPWRNFRLVSMLPRAGRTVFRLAYNTVTGAWAEGKEQTRLDQLDLDLAAWAAKASRDYSLRGKA